MTCNVNLSMTDSQLQSLLAKNASKQEEACEVDNFMDSADNVKESMAAD